MSFLTFLPAFPWNSTNCKTVGDCGDDNGLGDPLLLMSDNFTTSDIFPTLFFSASDLNSMFLKVVALLNMNTKELDCGGFWLICRDVRFATVREAHSVGNGKQSQCGLSLNRTGVS